MLKVMRNSFRHLKWILILIVLSFVVLIFVDWGGAGAGSIQSGEAYAAKVNGETITARDLYREIAFMEMRYEQLYGQRLTPEIRQTLNLPQQVLNSLIDQQILLQEAEKVNLSASEEEIRKKILEIPALSPEGKFVGADLYGQYITNRMGYSSTAEFEQQLAKEITLAKLESALQNSIAIPAKLAETNYRRQNESAKIRYIVYPAERAFPSVTVTPAELEAYYRSNSTNYAHPEQRHVKYLLADVARIQSQMSLDEKQLREQYDLRKEQYKTSEQVRAQHILISSPQSATPQEDAGSRTRTEALLAQIRAGASFDALAKANSADPSSAANGGDLGFFERGRMVPAFEEAAFTLPVGQVSDVIKTDYGYHIIKVLEKKPATYRSFDQVRPELGLAVMDERAKAIARDRINQVRLQIEKGNIKADAEIRKLTDDVINYNDAGWFAKSETVQGLGRVPALNDWTFNAEVNTFGTVIETSRGPILPFLVGSRPSGISAFAEVRATAEKDLKMEKARQAAKQSMASAIAGATTLDAAAAKLGVTPVEANVIRDLSIPGLAGNVQALVEAALNASMGSMQGPVVVASGAVAFQVTEQKRFDPQTFEAQKAGLIETMRRDEGRKLRTSMLDRLRKAAKITINQKIVQGGTATS